MDELISRQAVLDINESHHGQMPNHINHQIWQEIKELPSVSTEKIDAYKQGWHDAITTALKETHSVHTEEGYFRIVQEETLIGLGMAYEQVSTEKTGRWIRRIVDSGYNTDWSCSCCGYKVKTDFVNFKYCPECGSRNGEVGESE